jgi:Amt family ammonium transporter
MIQKLKSQVPQWLWRPARWSLTAALMAALVFLFGQGTAFAQEAEAVQKHADIVWTIVAAALVFFMQAGFAMVETGFTRAKNAANIMMKNLMDFCIGCCAFWFIGFGLMFGKSDGFFGTSWFAFNWQQAHEAGDWPFTFFVFQLVFAATAATIVSGAMAERTKFLAYLIYSLFISAIIYPISGGWAWNGLFGTTTAAQLAGWKIWATLISLDRGWCIW